MFKLSGLNGDQSANGFLAATFITLVASIASIAADSDYSKSRLHGQITKSPHQSKAVTPEEVKNADLVGRYGVIYHRECPVMS
jgi:hypothetical protein